MKWGRMLVTICLTTALLAPLPSHVAAELTASADAASGALLPAASANVDPFYPAYDDILSEMQDLADDHPAIASYQEIGQETHGGHRDIAVLKISDNVEAEEDEPAWAFTGQIHGSEQLGVRILLDLAEELTSGYDHDADVTDWVNAYEIWLVVVLNSWGYDHDSSGGSSVSGTRKNGTNTADVNTSGVDLARNYDFRWDQGGDPDPEESYFRGPEPFSEQETSAIRDLFLAQRPLFGLTFHQGNPPDGGEVKRPWSGSGADAAPDGERLLAIANLYADWVFASRSSGPFCDYSLTDPDGEGSCDDPLGAGDAAGGGDIEYCDELCWEPTQSTLGRYGQPSNWYYHEVGTFDYTVELSDRMFKGSFLYSASGPGNADEQAKKDILTELARNHVEAIQSWFAYFLHDTGPFEFTGPGLTGHISNALLSTPVAATVEIAGYTSALIEDRTADHTFGRYWRLLPAGTHNVTVSKPGYDPWNGTVAVGTGALTVLDVALMPQLEILLPMSTSLAYAGTPGSPRVFTVRVQLGGAGEPCVGGLEFGVEIRDDTSAWVPATVGPQACVQDHYWLSVTAPADGSFTAGQSYDLRVTLEAVQDESLGAVQFSDIANDTIYVMDRSNSMNDAGKLSAAKAAAELLAHELNNNDQGALVSFTGNGWEPDLDATLEYSLTQMSDANRTLLIGTIQGLVGEGWTSIGDGLDVALDESASARHDPDHLCGLVLLSDGEENEAAFWSDVRDRVAESPCVIHTIALGPESDEDLLWEISQTGGGGAGSYEYATITDVALASAATSSGDAATWRNALGGIFDYIGGLLDGRQRILSAAGLCSGEATLRTVVVDPTVREAYFVLKWQGHEYATLKLKDPNGVAVSPGYPGLHTRSGPTDQVYRLLNPRTGTWLAVIERAQGVREDVPYLLLASGQTDIIMRLFTSGDADPIQQGEEVLIGVLLSRADKAELGASVQASVLAPDGVHSLLTLYDDGAHADGEANDGFYANVYRRTVFHEAAAACGSYRVEASAVGPNFTREAMVSFVVGPARDSDRDGMPDPWETANGLDPADPNDAQQDPDGDGLPNLGEFQAGTDPHNSDTDGGGENDYSELQFGRDPLAPQDDQMSPVSGFALEALPGAVRVRWMPTQGLVYTLWRHHPARGWTVVSRSLPPTGDYTDKGLDNDLTYGYRLMASYPSSPLASALTPVLTATPRADPFPPTGNVAINGGAARTSSRRVTLSFQASPDTVEMRLSSDLADGSEDLGTPWMRFKPELARTIPPEVGDGQVWSVYAQFRDAAGNESAIVHEDIILQETAGPLRVFLPVIQRNLRPGAMVCTPTARQGNTPRPMTTATP